MSVNAKLLKNWGKTKNGPDYLFSKNRKDYCFYLFPVKADRIENIDFFIQRYIVTHIAATIKGGRIYPIMAAIIGQNPNMQFMNQWVIDITYAFINIVWIANTKKLDEINIGNCFMSL